MRRRATWSAAALTAASLLCVACGGPAPTGAPLQGQDRPSATASPASFASTVSPAPALGPGPTVTGPAPSARPPSKPATSADRALAAAFVAFARAPGRRTAARVPFADRVGLALTDDVRRTVARADVADPSRWRLRVDPARGWRERDGVFSALDLARTDANYVVLAGPHPQCPGTTPAPVPAGAADMRRVAVQPRPQDVTSCIDWWTVDLFVGRDGRVRFVTIDVGSP